MKTILLLDHKGAFHLMTGGDSYLAPDFGAVYKALTKLVNKGAERILAADAITLRRLGRCESPEYRKLFAAFDRACGEHEVLKSLAPWVRGSTTRVRKLKRTEVEDDGRIVVHTDGSCLGNPGFGGWAFCAGSVCKSGSAPKVTNNVMELTAVLKALRYFAAKKPGVPLRIISDSRYVVNGLNEWRHKWARRGFQGIANAELWSKLNDAYEAADAEVYWVKAHAGNEQNERADKAARDAAYALKGEKGDPWLNHMVKTAKQQSA